MGGSSAAIRSRRGCGSIVRAPVNRRPSWPVELDRCDAYARAFSGKVGTEFPSENATNEQSSAYSVFNETEYALVRAENPDVAIASAADRGPRGPTGSGQAGR